MNYNEKVYNAFEQFLLDNNIYSQYTTLIIERRNKTLQEVVNGLAHFPQLLPFVCNFVLNYPELDLDVKWRQYMIRYGL